MNTKYYRKLLCAGFIFSLSTWLMAADATDLHQKEHGGEFYSSTSLQQQWLINSHQSGRYEVEFDSSVGTDERRIRLNAEWEHAESAGDELDLRLQYSHMLDDFWNLDIGARYRQERNQSSQSSKSYHRSDVVFGVHGLAPYFVETEVYISLGQYQYQSFSIELERDFLVTQRWHIQPFIEAEYVLNDDASFASENGMKRWSWGIDQRYEWNKHIVPFARAEYRYESDQHHSTSQSKVKGGLYGLGLAVYF
jgi:copper resistance protein B